VPPIVYLVDDDLSFLRALSRLLRAADYRVQTFSSAEEFLKCDHSEAAGCVVLDLQMPGPSGLEVQEALAQSEEPLPVIFLTAHGDISSSVRAMKQGAVDFLTKPVRGDELLEAVQRALAWAPPTANAATEARVARSLRKADVARARGLCACGRRPSQ
jgi:FixJ family two-component response regulator